MVLPSISAAKASSGVSVGASGRERTRDPGRRHLAADDALAVIGLEPVDPRRLVRQALPDRQQQAGDDVDRAVGELRHLGELGLPGARRSVSRSASRQWVCAIIVSGMAVLLHRPDQAHAALDLAVVEHQARRRHLHGGAARLLVDQQHARADRRARSSASSSVTGRLRSRCGDGEQPGLGAGAGMGVDRRAGR